jgi:hypothetical protein
VSGSTHARRLALDPNPHRARTVPTAPPVGNAGKSTAEALVRITVDRRLLRNNCAIALSLKPDTRSGQSTSTPYGRKTPMTQCFRCRSSARPCFRRLALPLALGGFLQPRRDLSMAVEICAPL